MNPAYIVAIVVAGALAATGMLAEAHKSQEDDPFYLPLEVHVAEYNRTGYADFDLVRISLDITNEDYTSLNHPTFMLGGDSTATPGNSTGLPKAEYGPVSAEHVWNLNITVSPNDCTVDDQWGDIPASSTGSVPLCFVVEKSFRPNGLMVGGESGHRDENGLCFSSGSGYYYQRAHYNTGWPVCAMYVVPFQDDSTYCDRYSKYCDRDNVQRIPEWVMEEASAEAPQAPEATDEPEASAESAPATLQYAIYYNGSAILVFDQPVRVANQSEIGLVGDISMYQQNGSYVGLGEADVATADNKRQSQVLAFSLDNRTQAYVAASLEEYSELYVIVEAGAVKTAIDWADTTTHQGNEYIVLAVIVVW